MTPPSLRKGFAMPIVVTLMIIVGITLAGVFTVVNFSVRMMRQRTARTVCRCLAQSAIEHAKGHIKARFDSIVSVQPPEARAEAYGWFTAVGRARKWNQVIGSTSPDGPNAVRLDDLREEVLDVLERLEPLDVSDHLVKPENRGVPAVLDGCTVEVAIGESLEPPEINAEAKTARVIVPLVATAYYDYRCGTMTETIQERVVFELGQAEPYTQEWLKEWLIVPEEVNPAWESEEQGGVP